MEKRYIKCAINISSSARIQHRTSLPSVMIQTTHSMSAADVASTNGTTALSAANNLSLTSVKDMDCRFVNHVLHKREIEKAPHEEISILGDA